MLANNITQKKRFLKILPIAFLVIGFLVIVLVILNLVTTIKKPNSTSAEKKPFKVELGQGAGDVAQNLENEGLIKNNFAFIVYLNYKRAINKIQAGDYEIAQNLSIIQVAEIVTMGKTETSSITIPEGWDLIKIAERVEAKGISTKSQFLAQAKVKNYQSSYDFLKTAPKEATLEGYLYPDTYQLTKSATSDELIKKMLDNFGKKFTKEIRAKIPENKISTHEIITLASIVEREVAKPEDRQLVGSVFNNRLEIGMALESCATIQYILRENKQQFTYEETRTPSPYNTYLNRGLPPGPIGNPSIESILAAIEPPESDYLYFLSSKGTTYFSKTFQEHEAKKAKYL